MLLWAYLDPDFGWTAHKVELALWTHVMACQLDPSLLRDKSDSEEKEATTGNMRQRKRKTDSAPATSPKVLRQSTSRRK